MGLNKRDHIKAILAVPSVAQQWQHKHGRAASEVDIDGLYHAFTPIQVEVVKGRAVPIAGAVDLIAALRKQGVKVGSCSGYNEPISELRNRYMITPRHKRACPATRNVQWMSCGPRLPSMD